MSGWLVWKHARRYKGLIDEDSIERWRVGLSNSVDRRVLLIVVGYLRSNCRAFALWIVNSRCSSLPILLLSIADLVQ